jgi:glutaminase
MEETQVSNRTQPSPEQIRAAMKRAYDKFKGLKEGKNADYIPALAKVDSALFGIAIVTVDGQVFEVGDSGKAFTIQSVAKPFTAAALIDQMGADELSKQVGVNQTGQAFNSLLAMELLKMQERPPAGNPLVNPGAIASVGLLDAKTRDERWKKVSANLNGFAGRQLPLDQEVYESEKATFSRNQAFSYLLQNYEILQSDPMQALDIYTAQCSVAVTARELAMMGATLANGGVNPVTNKRVVSADAAQRTLSLMLTSGLYENSGEWSYDVGLPAKSGVGGGIVAVVPGQYAIATFAPPLDEAGNSVRGQRAIEAIAKELGSSIFSVPGGGRQAK